MGQITKYSIFRPYVLGFLAGMILEYLYRYKFVFPAFMVLVCVLILILIDILVAFKKTNTDDKSKGI